MHELECLSEVSVRLVEVKLRESEGAEVVLGGKLAFLSTMTVLA